MKVIYFLGLSLMASMLMAQETISFESSEGFSLDNLHNQNGWEVTEGLDGILTNQIITDEEASDGFYSFKNADEPDYEPQWLPIFGAAKSFAEALSFEEFSISYDIMVTQKLGADFEFTAYGINDVEEFNPIAGLGMENRGMIYVISSIDYDIEFIDGVEWEPNTWYNVKIEVNPDEIKYYFNDELIYTGENFTQLDISGFNMLHNNYGGSAYYDNIKINIPTMATTDLNANEIKTYPNPIVDQLNINSKETIQEIKIFNVGGQLVFDAKANKNSTSVNVSSLEKGVYIVQILTEKGTKTTKIIKN